VIRCDALIVGGGPAGSTCARILHRAGWRILVIDRARFPRDKVCAGWVTPGVFRLLDLDPADYRATGLTIQGINGFRTSLYGGTPIDTRYPTVVSYAIRRFEFDNYLLRRSQAHVIDGTPLASLERRDDVWVANGEIEASIVIGAGGHFCPVARQLAGPEKARAVVAKEAEFLVEPGDSPVAGEMPELFFCPDFEGYGWVVRKGNYLNIGIGRRDHGDLNEHVENFIGFLERTQRATRASAVKWRGHAYLAWGAGTRPLVGDGILLVGDAAGLAYPESGEGIKPAVESGRLAAETLLRTGKRASAADLKEYERDMRRRYPPARPTPPALAGPMRTLGRRLMRSRAFTRRVLIARWFLRT
jgi:geranylgeranyl reductase family protein